jgi:hypothetical protein
MAKALRVLALLMGIGCVAIGLFHVVAGIVAIPGEGGDDATIDSWSRFMGAIFAGYGAAWIWAARQRPIPASAIRWLAGVFLLGGLARVLSLAVHGWPQWFQVMLAVIELVMPPVYFWLADADERAAAGRPAADEQVLSS